MAGKSIEVKSVSKADPFETKERVRWDIGRFYVQDGIPVEASNSYSTLDELYKDFCKEKKMFSLRPKQRQAVMAELKVIKNNPTTDGNSSKSHTWSIPVDNVDWIVLISKNLWKPEKILKEDDEFLEDNLGAFPLVGSRSSRDLEEEVEDYPTDIKCDKGEFFNRL